jgi:hypothetical protein
MKTILDSTFALGTCLQRYRVVCHGSVPPSFEETAAYVAHPPPFTVHVVNTTHSTSGDGNRLTSLDIVLNNQSPQTSARAIRDYLRIVGHPIVGTTKGTKNLKSCKVNGLLMALVELEFPHPGKDTRVRVVIDEPARFEASGYIHHENAFLNTG